MGRLFDLLLYPCSLQRAKSCGDLRPFPVERGQPVFQGRDLSRYIVRTAKRIERFTRGNPPAILLRAVKSAFKF